MSIIRYYPPNMVLTNQSTTGNQFTLDGEPYTGEYYLTYDGKAFTGPNPAYGDNKLLIPIDASVLNSDLKKRIPRKRSSVTSQNIQDAFKAKSPDIQFTPVQLKQLTPYYPVVTDTDYERGYFTRYFAKKVNLKGYIFEISYESWALATNDTDPTFEDYQVLQVMWQLVGPKNDKRISQYEIASGVYDTNKRIIEGKAKGFIGLVQYIGGDYTKYARLDPED